MAKVRIYIVPASTIAAYDEAIPALREQPTSQGWDLFARAIDAQFESRMDLERLTGKGDWETPALWSGLRRMLVCRADKIDLNDDIIADLKADESAFVAATESVSEYHGDRSAATLLRYLLMDPRLGPCTRVCEPLGREDGPHAMLTPPEVEIMQRHRDMLPKLVAALDGGPIGLRLIRSDITKLHTVLGKMSYPFPTLYSVVT